jgi:MoaA/NifB/PqqE/SkfB family radical SAM enzyme
MRALSDSLGHIETLNLSGGEPFLRQEFGAICRQFIRRNGVRQIYVPTNGSFADRTVAAIEEVLQEPSLDLFAVEFSLDGLPAFHNRFRGMNDAFERAMDTYDALALLQRREPRLRLHAISTATADNIDEVRGLSAYLFDRCPQIDHHNLALLRGDRKNPTLQGPALAAYAALYDHIKRLWAPRESGRYGSSVEPLLQWAKMQTAEQQRQVVPCRAGVLSGVVYSNGDVSLCETLPPIGNLRQQTFPEIWRSETARAARRSVRAKECYCTNEVFMWPSITFQPLQLVRALAHVKPWANAAPAPSAAAQATAARGE